MIKIASVAEMMVSVSADLRGFNQGMDNAANKLDRLSKNIRGLDASKAVAGGLAVIGGGIAALGINALKIAGDMEQTEVAFTSLTGSAENANEIISDLTAFAGKTPFQIKGLTDSAKTLLAFGFSSDEAADTTRILADAVAQVGGGAAELDGVATALGQIQAKGKLSTEELLQLTERGIPAFDILKNELGLTGEQLDESLRKGAIDADSAVGALLKGMEERSKGAAEAQSNTFLGQLSTMRDNATNILGTIGTELIEAFNLTDSFKVINEALGEFLAVLQEEGLKEALRTIFPPEFDQTLFAIGGAILGALVPAVIALAASFAAAIIPLLPFIAAGVALGALAFLIVKNWDAIKKFFTKTIPEVWNNLVQKTVELKDKLVNDFNTMRDNVTIAVENLILKVLDFFRSLPGKAEAFFEDLVLKAKTKFDELKNKVITTAEDFVEGFIQNISKLPEQLGGIAVDLIKSIAGLQRKLFNKGLEIGKSLWGGFKKALGISSPSLIEMALLDIPKTANAALKNFDKIAPKFGTAAEMIVQPVPTTIAGDVRPFQLPRFQPRMMDEEREMNFTLNVNFNGPVNARNDQEIQEISEKLFRLQQDKLRQRGVRV